MTHNLLLATLILKTTSQARVNLPLTISRSWQLAGWS